ncbi:MAG: hypothetical protein ACRDCH_02045 [Metamycoplasmataceae bacterium]
MSILTKKIRFKTTSEVYLKNLAEKLKELIISLSESGKSNVEEIIWRESKGAFGFEDGSCFEKIENALDITKISFDQQSLDYINVLWEIILKMEMSEEYVVNGFYQSKMKVVSNLKHKIIFEIEKNSVIFALEELIPESKYYFIDFNSIKGFTFANEQYLIDTINDKYLANLFSLYRNSKSFDEKYSHLSNICKKLVFLFDKNKSKETYEFIKDKIGDKESSRFCGKMHGYFRHTNNDSDGKEAQEWTKFSENKKNKVCEETFIDLLYFLSILRINNLLPEIK